MAMFCRKWSLSCHTAFLRKNLKELELVKNVIPKLVGQSFIIILGVMAGSISLVFANASLFDYGMVELLQLLAWIGLVFAGLYLIYYLLKVFVGRKINSGHPIRSATDAADATKTAASPATSTAGEIWRLVKNRDSWFITIINVIALGSLFGFSLTSTILIKSVFPSLDNLYLLLGLLGIVAVLVAMVLGERMVLAWTEANTGFYAGVGLVLTQIGLIFFLDIGSFVGFLLAFIMIFFGLGVGIYANLSIMASKFEPEQAAKLLAFATMLATFAFYLIPRIFAWSLLESGLIVNALGLILGLYLIKLFILKNFYMERPGPEDFCNHGYI